MLDKSLNSAIEMDTSLSSYEITEAENKKIFVRIEVCNF
jgi:hypothetical protein